MNDEISKMKLEHEKSYKSAIIDILKNNTEALVNDDIKSLLKEPPLDSMDTLRCKILGFAKKNKIIVNTVHLTEILTKYRENLIKICDEIFNIRFSLLKKKVDDFKFNKKNDVIKINRKDFSDINKKIKRITKNAIVENYNKYLEKDLYKIFGKEIEEKILDSFINEFNKFFSKTYQKQLLESIDIKILIKDTTLMNITKEQGERYLFIINNSRIFSEE